MRRGKGKKAHRPPGVKQRFGQIIEPDCDFFRDLLARFHSEMPIVQHSSDTNHSLDVHHFDTWILPCHPLPDSRELLNPPAGDAETWNQHFVGHPASGTDDQHSVPAILQECTEL
jgi:hypothetical protein